MFLTFLEAETPSGQDTAVACAHASSVSVQRAHQIDSPNLIFKCQLHPDDGWADSFPSSPQDGTVLRCLLGRAARSQDATRPGGLPAAKAGGLWHRPQ